MTAVQPGSGPRVAYQGEPGAFGEMAIVREWNGRATPVTATTFADAITMLDSGSADYAVLPVWNSTIGDIHDTHLLLSHYASRVKHVSAVTVPVVHCLLSLPRGSRSALRYVGSHSVALGQCRRLFTSRPPLQPCVAYDTAGAARELATLGNGSPPRAARRAAAPWFDPYRPIEPHALGVLASSLAAELYGLTILAEGVQDDPTNRTRFVVVEWRR